VGAAAEEDRQHKGAGAKSLLGLLELCHDLDPSG